MRGRKKQVFRVCGHARSHGSFTENRGGCSHVFIVPVSSAKSSPFRRRPLQPGRPGDPYSRIFVYYALYFAVKPAKIFETIWRVPTGNPRVLPSATGNFTRNLPGFFSVFCVLFSLFSKIFHIPDNIFIYIKFLIIFVYKQLSTFSTWFSTVGFPLYINSYRNYCIFLPAPVMRIYSALIFPFFFT